jgi:hypothetical protein
MLLQDTEKNVLSECTYFRSFLSVTTDSEGEGSFTECYGMLAVHVLYLMYIWKSRLLVKDSLSSVPDVLRRVQVKPTLHKNSSCSLIVFSVCKSSTRCACTTHILLMDSSAVDREP